MTQDQKKRLAAEAALERVEAGSVIGVGTGSTTNHFIDALVLKPRHIAGAVASSLATAERLAGGGVPVIDLDDVGELPLYLDGADEATREGWLVKGGGGALTREKIIAASSREFVCIVDDTKLVDRLGCFPLPVEIIPMARRLVCRELEHLGGRPELRRDFVTDNGNLVLDVFDLAMGDPVSLEAELTLITGVVCVGLFCRRPADRVLVGGSSGVETIIP